MNYGYIRVSSDKQTVENQRFEILRFCEREQIKVDGWIEETVSGTKQYDKRQLGKLLNKVKDNDDFCGCVHVCVGMGCVPAGISGGQSAGILSLIVRRSALWLLMQSVCLFWCCCF